MANRFHGFHLLIYPADLQLNTANSSISMTGLALYRVCEQESLAFLCKEDCLPQTGHWPTPATGPNLISLQARVKRLCQSACTPSVSTFLHASGNPILTARSGRGSRLVWRCDCSNFFLGYCMAIARSGPSSFGSETDSSLFAKNFESSTQTTCAKIPSVDSFPGE